jgi:predicted AAA+ superfamily ATPase
VDASCGRRLYATGSSSFELEARTRESLAGRAHRLLLLPFSLAEIRATVPGPERLREARLEAESQRHAIFGGYPAVVLGEKPANELAELVESFVLRDASDRFAIRNIQAFRRLLEVAASRIGNLCNLTGWAGTVSASYSTLVDYLELLEETHILRLVRPFVGGRRAEITLAPKVFFLDNGVRNQLFGGFTELTRRPDHGALLENLVFTELAKVTNPLLDTIHFWRSKAGAEVDFVVRHQGRLAAVEVKAGGPPGRIPRPARSFVDAYSPELLLVVGRGAAPDATLGATSVRFLRPWELHPALAPFLSSD